MTATASTPALPVFTEAEVRYLASQRLGRIATVGQGGTPHVFAVGFRLQPDGESIGIGGHALDGSKKWRD